jgi:hypothetical protein
MLVGPENTDIEKFTINASILIFSVAFGFFGKFLLNDFLMFRHNRLAKKIRSAIKDNIDSLEVK